MKIQTKAHILIIIILFQSLCVLLLSNQALLIEINDLTPNMSFSYPIIWISNILGLCTIISIYYILRFLKMEKESIIKLNYSREVIDALQGQKHDFNNHLNLISSMLQVDKPEKALEYIFNISQKVDEVFSVSKIDNIEVAATLCRKCAIAESKGITVELEIDASLEFIKMNPIDLSRVLFNLLDNAIYELENCHEDEKILSIDITNHDNMYCISVGNSYPVLPKELYHKIFEPRYTTKTGENHGYGLSIVKQMVEKNKGHMTVESYEGVGTIFTVFLPQKPPS